MSDDGPSATSGASRIVIVGFGNSLMADDGVGPAVAAALRANGLPHGVRVEDGESDSLRLAALWRGEPEVWLIDALLRGAPPGTVHRLAHDELLAVPQRHGTAHHLSLPESLRWLAIADPAMASVRYRMWGIEPAVIAPRPALSLSVLAVVPVVAAEILAAAASTVRGDG